MGSSALWGQLQSVGQGARVSSRSGPSPELESVNLDHKERIPGEKGGRTHSGLGLDRLWFLNDGLLGLLPPEAEHH